MLIFCWLSIEYCLLEGTLMLSLVFLFKHISMDTFNVVAQLFISNVWNNMYHFSLSQLIQTRNFSLPFSLFFGVLLLPCYMWPLSLSSSMTQLVCYRLLIFLKHMLGHVWYPYNSSFDISETHFGGDSTSDPSLIQI